MAQDSLSNIEETFMYDTDKQKLRNLKNAWGAANASGDTTGMKAAHDEAEAIRKMYGFSGGDDGSQLIMLPGMPTTGADVTGSLPSGGANDGSNYSSDPFAESYINSIYDAQQAATEAALKKAYDQNVSTLSSEKAKIPETYAAAKNQTAANSETQRQNFNEYAAASGLNSGTGGQAALMFSNQLQGNLAAINQAQSDALSNIDSQLANLQTQYQNDLAQAFAEGNLNKVSSLYNNYETEKERMLSQQQYDRQYKDAKSADERTWTLNSANFTGNYSGMATYGWTPEMIAAAEKEWKRLRSLSV